MALPPEGEAAALRQRLQQRELEVAELIDELGHLESVIATAAPASSVHAYAEATTALVAYVGTLERAVLLPALGVADAASVDAPSRTRAINAAATLHDTRVTSALQSLARPASEAELETARRFRASLRDSAVAQPLRLSTEDAFVVCGALVESQMELRELSTAALRVLRASGAAAMTSTTRDANTITDLSADFVDDIRIRLLGPLHDELRALRRDVEQAEAASGAGDASDVAAVIEDFARARAAYENGLRNLSARENAAAAAVEAAAAATAAAAAETKTAAAALTAPTAAAATSTSAVAELQALWYGERTHLMAQLAALEGALDAARIEHAATRDSLEATRAVAEDRLAERDAFRREADHLRASLVSTAPFPAGGPIIVPDDGRAAHEARLELDRVTREHSAALTAAHSEAAAMRTENLRLRQSLAGSSSHRGAMDALQRTNERLQDEIQSLRAQLVAASVPAPTLTDETESLRVSVQRLGEQVAATEGRLREVVRGRDEDQARYEQLLRDERTRSQQERDECDLLVWRMSREIDTLARDNADLKGRLNRLCDP